MASIVLPGAGVGSNQGPLVFAIFLVAQVLDAAFTYRGVTQWGLGVEMNTLMVHAMEAIGPGPALVLAKIFACLCGFYLHVTERHRPLAIATGACIGVAVVPWFFALLLL
ncbi:MAG: DUF5658 family protein [Vicinamibacterales bacterium]